MKIETIAAMVRFGSLRRQALSPELQARLDSFEQGDLAEDEDLNPSELREDAPDSIFAARQDCDIPPANTGQNVR